MKNVLKGLWGFVEVIIIIYVICITAFLLCKNNYGFTQIGDMTFITIDEEAINYLPEAKENDLLLVRADSSDIEVGDKIYYYDTENSMYVVKSAHVKTIQTSDSGMGVYTLDDSEESTIATTRAIGKYSTTYKTIGGILDILQSRLGFLLLVILPILLIFMYQIYALIVVIKYGDEEEKKEVTPSNQDKKENIELL